MEFGHYRSLCYLRLTFAPFAQQVVLIEQRDVISPADTATFGYAHNYTRELAPQLTTSWAGKHR
jgi:hypothetical protein